MSIGNKQTFYICKATCSKKQVSTFAFSFIANLRMIKIELMVYASSLQTQNTNINVSNLFFVFFQKQQ